MFVFDSQVILLNFFFFKTFQTICFPYYHFVSSPALLTLFRIPPRAFLSDFEHSFFPNPLAIPTPTPLIPDSRVYRLKKEEKEGKKKLKL